LKESNVSTDTIKVEDKAGVRLITLNRADKKNAITEAMYAAMANAINTAQDDPALRVVMLTGSGDVFTAGNDMGAFLNPKARMGDVDLPVEQFLQAILRAEKPLLAAVNGLAIGIGTTMLLHCDLVYAADTARFSVPFINLGLMPEAGSSLLLPMAVGTKKAAQMLMFGDYHSAEEAADFGLINEVFAADMLMDKAIERAKALAAKPPAALLLIKDLLKREPESPARRMARESALFGERLQSAECKEAATAFFEKRDPDFSNC
jgi:enoyl-CoA hydratase/carnithine racemase